MNTYSALAMANQRQAEDMERASMRRNPKVRQNALASEVAPRQGLTIRRLLRLRRASLPDAAVVPQGAVGSWRLSH
jgi:hypothetical protein